MLFTYSNKALSENWLNPLIVQILNDGMLTIISGYQVSEWPKIIPSFYRSKLRKRSGIKKRLIKFWSEFENLEQLEQQAMLEALTQQTSLPNILLNDKACAKIDTFPEGIKNATVDLFRFLFDEQLTSLKVGDKCIRDVHYHSIYTEIPSRICPFCGLGHFRAPGAPRNALDHYMPISRYPFVGADLRNLPPMCSECNSDFKGNKDILFDELGQRQQCVDPYNGPFFSVSLADSLLFAGSVQDALHLPIWNINFFGGTQEIAENWDRVFKIRERYKRDVLDAEFRSWLQHFVFWYLAQPNIQKTGHDVAAYLPEYIETVIQDNLADRAFLKVEVFRLLNNECKNIERGQDMREFLEILITHVQ